MKTTLAIICSMVLGIAIGYSSQKPGNVTRTVLSIPADVNDGVTVSVPDHISHDQAYLLNTAYEAAKRDGLPHPQLMQAVILQESNAGSAPVYKVTGSTQARQYGVGQIKLDAAKDVLKRYPELYAEYNFQTRTNDELIAKLIEDDEFNIAIASKYMKILMGYGYHSPQALAVAYNKGPGGAAGVIYAEDSYAKGVSKHLSALPRDKLASGLYHVQSGDSLSKIATASGVTMDSIFNANPKAFPTGDPNVLIANVDITIPTKTP